MTNRTMLVEGYSAKPKPTMVNDGLQPSASGGSKPPTAAQLPRGAQSTVKPPKSN